MFAGIGPGLKEETARATPIFECFHAALACAGVGSCKIGICQAVFKIGALQLLVKEARAETVTCPDRIYRLDRRGQTPPPYLRTNGRLGAALQEHHLGQPCKDTRRLREIISTR